MNITPECIGCIFNQALKVSQVLGLDDKESQAILNIAAAHVPRFSLDKSPPTNATPLYQEMADYLDKKDLYDDIKMRSQESAQKLKPKCEMILKRSLSPFVTATKIAVIGNVIDLASPMAYDLDVAVDEVLGNDFAIDDTEALERRLKDAKTVVYLADNAGENIFDAIYIDYLKSQFPDLKVYYFLRGAPIINDLTMDDIAKEDPLRQLSTLIDSGVKTPGIVYDKMSKEAQILFDEADCIISKGMGNYECLSTNETHPLFFLLKIKCQVVATSLNRPLSAIICKENYTK